MEQRGKRSGKFWREGRGEATLKRGFEGEIRPFLAQAEIQVAFVLVGY